MCAHRRASMFYKYTQGQAKYVHLSVFVPPPHMRTHTRAHIHGQAERDSRTWSHRGLGLGPGWSEAKRPGRPPSTPHREARDQAGLGALANQGLPPPNLGSLPCPQVSQEEGDRGREGPGDIASSTVICSHSLTLHGVSVWV